MAKISYREKRAAYDGMKGAQYFEADMELLKAKNKDHELCKRKYFKPEKHQPEALWALLDVVGKDEIVKNRRRWFSKKEKQEIRARLDECTALLKKAKAAKTKEEAQALLVTLNEKIEELPEDVREQLDAIDEKALLEDFESSKGEKLPGADDTEKTAEGTGEKTEVKEAETGKENELEADNETEKEKAVEAEQQTGSDSDNSEKVDAKTDKTEPEKKDSQPKPAAKSGSETQKKTVANSKKNKSTQKSTGKTSKK